jgi:hypothetical protein
MQDIYEEFICHVCSNIYGDDRVPYIVSCGDSICELCYNKCNKKICPICNKSFDICFQNLALLNVANVYKDKMPKSQPVYTLDSVEKIEDIKHVKNKPELYEKIIEITMKDACFSLIEREDITKGIISHVSDDIIINIINKCCMEYLAIMNKFNVSDRISAIKNKETRDILLAKLKDATS